jgi:tetratricopeptide (TPR) repeat protein
MTREGLFSLLVAGWLSVGMTPAWAEPDGPSRIEKLLAVNAALRQGRDHLQRGEYASAVAVLESRVEWIDANREYLFTLRDAYMGHVRQLKQAGKDDEVERYLKRLRALDAGAVLELNAPQPPAPENLVMNTAPPSEKKELPQTSPPGPAPTGEPRVVRGEVDDPFADSNSVPSEKRVANEDAKILLERAEAEYRKGQYKTASRFYESAHRVAPQLLADCKERWAYCKMHQVVESLNRTGAEVNRDQLEQEVRQAIALAPSRLDQFGQDLLKKIQLRSAKGPAEPLADTSEIAVEHLEPQGGWQIAQSNNFRVLHNQSRDVAERTARIAESTKRSSAFKWFGDDGGTWTPRCEIVLHSTGEDYSRATGQTASCPGHSTIQTAGERVVSRRIDVHVDAANLLAGVIPHETTHVVLAGRFGEKDLPRWVDEGMAVLTEPPELVQKHLSNLREYRRAGSLFRMSSLLPMVQYPERRYVGSFYAQSISVVDYLVSLKNPRAFSQFVHEGLYQGWEQALQRHYGIAGFADLEQRWLSHAFGGEKPAKAIAASGQP